MQGNRTAGNWKKPSDGPSASCVGSARTQWLNDPTQLPIGQSAIPDALDHAAGREVASIRLDNCFSGWDGAASLGLGFANMTIEATDAFRHLQVYMLEGEDFFCEEPVTHRPDAINTRNGMTELPAGETLSRPVTFRMTDA